MVAVAILFAGFMIADVIMFVNGYRSYLFGAKTDQEKKVRANWFAVRGIEWDDKQ
jgi:hypothetical protein